VLNVISRSTADVQPVLDTVVNTAVRLCGADNASILIREGEVYRHVSSSYSASDPEYWAILRQRTIVPGRGSVIGRVALEGRVVHVADIRADPDYAFSDSLAAGRRTMLGVPLLLTFSGRGRKLEPAPPRGQTIASPRRRRARDHHRIFKGVRMPAVRVHHPWLRRIGN
jgi:hypothetical protein